MAISFFRQAFAGKPTFTETDMPDLTDRVIIVTGANSGIGKEAAQILYSKNAKVYMLARSEEKTQRAIDEIRAAVPQSAGDMIYIRLDLADLQSVKASAEEFLRRETKLHLLFNNAGLGYPERGSTTKQGYELTLGVNCIGPFAFTKLLTPLLVSTAKTSPANAVRVVWTSSSAAEGTSPNGFVEKLPDMAKKGSVEQYFTSKLGNYLQAAEFAARHRADGIVSVSLNPGNLDSDFWRSMGPVMLWFLRKLLLSPTIYGAYTLLFAGCSPQVTLEKSGRFIAPWGRFWNVSSAMVKASKTKSEGGTGVARDFWAWTDAQVSLHI
ncbi:NAD(P)-binding protein [Hypoxylon cercidicola]|nr:NAD(P)-binding protein [Hypoxylon cercidicola]